MICNDVSNYYTHTSCHELLHGWVFKNLFLNLFSGRSAMVRGNLLASISVNLLIKKNSFRACPTSNEHISRTFIGRFVICGKQSKSISAFSLELLRLALEILLLRLNEGSLLRLIDGILLRLSTEESLLVLFSDSFIRASFLLR